MTRLSEVDSRGGHEEHVFPCDCGAGHFLQFTWDDDPDFRYMWVTGESIQRGLWKRLKEAWKILRGKPSVHTEIVLNDITVQSLKRALDDVHG